MQHNVPSCISTRLLMQLGMAHLLCSYAHASPSSALPLSISRPNPAASCRPPPPAVTKPRDQAVDAEFFSYVTDAGLELVNRLKQGGRTYSAGDLLRRLKARFVGELDAQAAGAEDPEAFNWWVLHPWVLGGVGQYL